MSTLAQACFTQPPLTLATTGTRPPTAAVADGVLTATFANHDGNARSVVASGLPAVDCTGVAVPIALSLPNTDVGRNTVTLTWTDAATGTQLRIDLVLGSESLAVTGYLRDSVGNDLGSRPLTYDDLGGAPLTRVRCTFGGTASSPRVLPELEYGGTWHGPTNYTDGFDGSALAATGQTPARGWTPAALVLTPECANNGYWDGQIAVGPINGNTSAMGPAIQSLAIDQSNATLGGGASEQYTATATLVGGGTRPVTSADAPTWAKTGALTINGSTGAATAPATAQAQQTGTVSVTVGGLTATTNWTVAAGVPAVTSVTTTTPGPFQSPIGSTVTLAATAVAVYGASSAITWTTTDVLKVEVSNAGVCSVVGSGTATVRAASTFDPTRFVDISFTVPTPNGVVDLSVLITGAVALMQAPGSNLDLLVTGFNALVANQLTQTALQTLVDARVAAQLTAAGLTPTRTGSLDKLVTLTVDGTGKVTATNGGAALTGPQAQALADLGVALPGLAKTTDVSGVAKTSDLGPIAKTADLAGVAKTSDLTPIAKTADLGPVAKTADLSPVAKTSDVTTAVTPLAKTTDLTPLAKTSDLTPVAKTADLTPLAKTSDLAGVAKTTDLAPVAKTSELNPLAKTSDLTPVAKTADLAPLAKPSDITTALTNPPAGLTRALVGAQQAASPARTLDTLGTPVPIVGYRSSQVTLPDGTTGVQWAGYDALGDAVAIFAPGPLGTPQPTGA